MICKNCQQENAADAQFCIKCGTKVITHPQEAALSGITTDKSAEGSQQTTPDTASIKKKSKGWLIFLFLVICTAATIGFIFYNQYINSASYKIEQAEEFLNRHNYEEAASCLTDINTEQSSLYLDYIEIEKAKNIFLQACQTGSLSTSTEYYDIFSQLVNKFENTWGTKLNLLPIELQPDYLCYRSAVKYIASLNYPFEELQTVCLNVASLSDISYGTQITDELILSMQKRNQTTENAITAFNDWVYYKFTFFPITRSDVLTYCHTSYQINTVGIPLSTEFSGLFDSFFEIIQDLLSKFQDRTDPNSSDFLKKSNTSELDFYKRTDITPFSLLNITHKNNLLSTPATNEDIESNATNILNALKSEILYYLITGESLQKGVIL